MKSENISTVRNVVIAVVLTLALLFGAGYLPFLSALCFICGGVPLAVIASRYELKVTALAFFITGLAFFPLSGYWINAVTTMIIVVLPGVIAGYMLGRKQPFYSVFIVVCTFICVGWIIEFTAMEKFFGIKILNNMLETVNANTDILMANMEKYGANIQNADVGALVNEIIGMVGTLMVVYFPSFVVVLSIIMGYILIRVCGFVIRKTKMAEIDIVPFSMMKVPRSMCWVAVIVYLVYIFSTPMGTVWSLLANVVFVLYTIIVFGGLSCVDYWLSKSIKMAPLRVLCYLAVATVLTMIGAISLVIDVLVIIAILDSGRNFRRIGKEHEAEL